MSKLENMKSIHSPEQGGGSQTMGSPYKPAPRNAVPLGSPNNPLRPLGGQSRLAPGAGDVSPDWIRRGRMIPIGHKDYGKIK